VGVRVRALEWAWQGVRVGVAHRVRVGVAHFCWRRGKFFFGNR